MRSMVVQPVEVGPVPAGLSWSIDGPAPGSVHHEWVFVWGWVVSPEGEGPVTRVTVHSAEECIGELWVGQIRPDVEAALAPRPAANSGFSGDIRVPAGADALLVRAHWSVNSPETSAETSAVIGALHLIASDAHPPDPIALSTLPEVAIVRSLVSPMVPRLVVDIGAHDGWTLSNSYPFVAAGWRAVLVEPLPTVFEQLRGNHRRHPLATCVPVACSDVDGTGELFLGNDGDTGMNSTLSTDDNAWMRSTRSERTIKVAVQKASSLLGELGIESDVGLLLVDCEGMDLEALAGVDPTRHLPWIVVTERYESNPAKEEAKRALLSSWGLVRHERTDVNDVWCRPSLLRT